jgi:Ca2+-binding EF-hand superfamily protein
VQSIKEVKHILDNVDASGNGQIEFEEFLMFIKKTSDMKSSSVSS